MWTDSVAGQGVKTTMNCLPHGKWHLGLVGWREQILLQQSRPNALKKSLFEKNETNLLGHPVINRKMGIDFSNGSLGMGLSLGIGVALAAKKRKKNFNVYVILGDGECNEGSVWEAAMAAPHFELDNLTIIIDKNNFQQTGSNNEIMKTENMKNKWDSFGWNTTEVDGHDIKSFCGCLDDSNNQKPKAIIANTIKGKGFSFSENNNEWHHSVLSKSNYDKALKELEELK